MLPRSRREPRATIGTLLVVALAAALMGLAIPLTTASIPSHWGRAYEVEDAL
jgi:hypothetical protein